MENVLIYISNKIWDTEDSGGERTEWNRVRATAKECDRWKDLHKASTTTTAGKGFD
jgi:hypothetical protein